jgi:hypothetical protein
MFCKESCIFSRAVRITQEMVMVGLQATLICFCLCLSLTLALNYTVTVLSTEPNPVLSYLEGSTNFTSSLAQHYFPPQCPYFILRFIFILPSIQPLLGQCYYKSTTFGHSSTCSELPSKTWNMCIPYSFFPLIILVYY